MLLSSSSAGISHSDKWHLCDVLSVPISELLALSVQLKQRCQCCTSPAFPLTRFPPDPYRRKTLEIWQRGLSSTALIAVRACGCLLWVTAETGDFWLILVFLCSVSFFFFFADVDDCQGQCLNGGSCKVGLCVCVWYFIPIDMTCQCFGGLSSSFWHGFWPFFPPPITSPHLFSKIATAESFFGERTGGKERKPSGKKKKRLERERAGESERERKSAGGRQAGWTQ